MPRFLIGMTLQASIEAESKDAAEAWLRKHLDGVVEENKLCCFNPVAGIIVELPEPQNEQLFSTLGDSPSLN